MPKEARKIVHELPKNEVKTDISTILNRFHYRKEGLDIRPMCSAELASIYREKFKNDKSVNTSLVNSKLIEKYRQLYLDILEKMHLEYADNKDVITANKEQVVKFEHGALDTEAFIKIAKYIGLDVRNGFLKVLGAKFLENFKKILENFKKMSVNFIFFTNMKNSETKKEKSGEEVATLYREKFASTSRVNINAITADLIEKIRDNFDLGDIVAEKVKNETTRELFGEIASTQRQRLDNGDFSIGELSSIAKQYDIALRDGFLKTLGTELWNKISKKRQE